MTDSPELAAIRARDAIFNPHKGKPYDRSLWDVRTLLRMLDEARSMVDYPAIIRERDALAADRDRWQEDSMRQAATINRLAAAAEDRNKVDAKRQELHEADLRALAAECNEQARLNGMGAERELALMARVQALEAEIANWRMISNRDQLAIIFQAQRIAQLEAALRLFAESANDDWVRTKSARLLAQQSETEGERP